MAEHMLQFEVVGGVATVTLNRPRVHNALNDEMRTLLADAFDEAGRRDDVRAVLLRGNGRSFCSGRDTTRFVAPGEGSSHAEMIVAAQRVRLKQLGCGKPIVGALHGHVIGAGAELALGCDMRVAASDLKFSLPETRHGLVADTGSSTLLTALVGPARAKWILLSGLPISGDQSLQWGLADWVVPPERLEAFARDLATTLASQPPMAVARQKSLIDVQFDREVRAGLAREMDAQLELFAGPERKRIAEEGA